MDIRLNLPLELLLTGIQFATLWLLFYKLYYQESKTKRILLIICMALFHPFEMFVSGIFFPTHMIIKLLLPIAAYAILAILAGGEKKNVCIMAAYHWGIAFFIDTIMGALSLGLTGNSLWATSDMYLKANIIYETVIFLWAAFYYSVMKAVPQEALNRMPLRTWIVILITPVIGAAASYAVVDTFLKQLEAGYNNFLFFSFFCITLLVLNLLIFYLFIKLVSSHNALLLAGELSKTPLVYTPQNGLSAEFIEKYDLSKRQVEITEALLKGKSNKEIATLMDIEVNTVQVHLQNIYRKTGSPGRYALMALVGAGKSTVNPVK